MRLTARSQDGSSTTVEVVDGLLIGRDPGCDLPLDDERVSRRHAYLTVHPDGRISIQDLGSGNGTLVNGIRIEGPVALQGGEEIRIGNVVISVEATTPAVPAQGDPHIGAVLNDRYRIDRVISAGGVGIVYLGQDLRLDRTVAIKVLATHLFQDDRSRQRFVNEARAGSIEHPNIIHIYDTDQWGDEPYVVMRYVHGGDLATRLTRDGRLSPETALPIVRQIGAALDAANARGLVHRDVKPGNVLITDSGDPEGEGHAFLCDFGIAKNVGGGAALTRPGFAPGTRHYMAPELFRGEAIDGRADQYALGCVLYEALSGLHPYERDSEEALMFAHLQDPVPSLTSVRPDLAWLDPVLARAMAKDRDRRFVTCAEFVTAAEAARASAAAPVAAPVAAAPPVTPVTPQPVGVGTLPDAPAATSPGGVPQPPQPPTAQPPAWQPPQVPVQMPPQGPPQPPQVPPVMVPPAGGGGKSKTPLIAALVAAVVLLAAISVYFLTKGGNEERAAAPSPTPVITITQTETATPTPTPTESIDVIETTTPEPTVTESASTFSADEQYLLGLVPTAIKNTCVPGGTTVSQASARISCEAQGGAVHVQYNYFKNPKELVDGYFFFMKKQGVVPNSGDCRVNIFGESGWGDNEGRVFCYRENNPRESWIEWMNYSVGVYAFAWRDDWRDRDLYQWWRNSSI